MQSKPSLLLLAGLLASGLAHSSPTAWWSGATAGNPPVSEPKFARSGLPNVVTPTLTPISSSAPLPGPGPDSLGRPKKDTSDHNLLLEYPGVQYVRNTALLD